MPRPRLIDKTNQVMPRRKKPQAFTTGDRADRGPHPPALGFGVIREDTKRFQEAVAKTGAPLSRTEPIVALALRFEAELDLNLAAAEAGLRPGELLQTLEHFPHLARHLGPLRVAGGTVQRQVLVDVFQDLSEAVHTSRLTLARNPEVDRLLDQGYSLIADQPGDAAQFVGAAHRAAVLAGIRKKAAQ